MIKTLAKVGRTITQGLGFFWFLTAKLLPGFIKWKVQGSVQIRVLGIPHQAVVDEALALLDEIAEVETRQPGLMSQREASGRDYVPAYKCDAANLKLIWHPRGEEPLKLPGHDVV